MKIHIHREIKIKKTNQEIYNIVSNIQHWSKWSPWMHMEPSAKIELSGTPHQTGQSLTWHGDVIGSGRMTIESLNEKSAVEMSLEFFAPHKNFATTRFVISSTAQNETTLAWSMDTKIPFFLFFLKKMMETFMGADFERGLNMLKELSENGTVASRSINRGVGSKKGFQIIGKKVHCQFSEIASETTKVFSELNLALENKKIEPPQAAMSLTHDFNFAKRNCVFTVGFQYPIERKVDAPQGFESHQFPDHEALVVDHYGVYSNLRNPWALAMGYQRSKKLKVSKIIPVYEVYLNSPYGTADADIHTQIAIPLR